MKVSFLVDDGRVRTMEKRQGNRSQTGFVWIVGAGPGDARLLTLKAKYCLEQADVVIYDRLVSPSVLSLAPPNAEFIYSGKTPKGEKTSQEWINKTMIAKAKEGKKVVRLKNGDPFVFGRGAEEAEALYNAGVPFEIVPGVTSVVAVPAYAGIPLTDRRFASNFAVLVGKKAKGKNPKHLADFQKLAQADTVIALMAVEELEEVTEQIMSGGKPPDTPAAIIEWGTTPRQKVVVSTLKNLSRDARAHDIQPPAVIVTGEVVKFRESLAWYEHRPLFGKRILIANIEGMETFANALGDLGAEVINLPVAKFEPNTAEASLEKVLNEVVKGNYEWIVFSNPYGVETFFESVYQRGFDVRAFPSIKFAAIGPFTKEALKQRGIHPNVVIERRNGKKAAEIFIPMTKKQKEKTRFLIWDGDNEFGGLVEGLSQLGRTDRVRAYRTVTVPLPEGFLNLVLREPIHIVIFTTPLVIEAFFEAVGVEKSRQILTKADLTVFVSSSEQTLKRHGIKPSTILEVSSIKEVANSLVRILPKG